MALKELSFDLMQIDPEELINIIGHWHKNSLDELFTIYIGLLSLPAEDAETLRSMILSSDKDNAYMAQIIIINKIRELQSNSTPRDPDDSQLQNPL